MLIEGLARPVKDSWRNKIKRRLNKWTKMKQINAERCMVTVPHTFCMPK
jgi:hypothetical protein